MWSNSITYLYLLDSQRDRSARADRHRRPPRARQPLPPAARRQAGARRRPAARPRPWSRARPRRRASRSRRRRGHPRPQRLRVRAPRCSPGGTAPTTSSPPTSGSPFAHVGVRDGDVVDVGGLDVEVLARPGPHPSTTRRSSSRDDGHGPGRPALAAAACCTAPSAAPTWSTPDRTADLARAQWATARRLGELAAPHRAAPDPRLRQLLRRRRRRAEDDGGTVGEEHLVNPALTLDLRHLRRPTCSPATGRCPPTTAHMAGLNRAGAGDSPGRPAGRVTVEGVTDAVLAGQWVIDVRAARRFADGHVRRQPSTSSTATSSRRTSAGWCRGRTTSCCSPTTRPRLDAAVTDLAGIGIEGVGTHVLDAGDAAAREPTAGSDWEALRETDRADRCCSTSAGTTSSTPAALPGALHVPLHELDERLDELPAGRDLGPLPLRLPRRHRRQPPAARGPRRRARRRRPRPGGRAGAPRSAARSPPRPDRPTRTERQLPRPGAHQY